MGLDQIAYATAWTLEEIENPDIETQLEQIAGWRKHNRLQGYMENLWREKTGSVDMFNCEYLQLTSEDIDALETAIENRHLPETSGFFFEDDSYQDYEVFDAPRDRRFIEKARPALKQGLNVFYWSWW